MLDVLVKFVNLEMRGRRLQLQKNPSVLKTRRSGVHGHFNRRFERLGGRAAAVAIPLKPPPHCAVSVCYRFAPGLSL